MELQHNKILITGATAGIGRALTEKFIALGNEVIAVGRNQRKLDELEQLSTSVIPFRCDITNQNDLDKLSVFVEQQHPNLNMLINNAGIQYNYHFIEEPQPLAKINNEVNANFLAPLKLITLLLPVLNTNSNAAIVNISSGLGLVPKMSAPVYCGTKAGLHIFTKSLRYQLDKIKVFEVVPPLVDTDMTAGRGKGKISPEQLVDEFIRGFAKDKFEINIGKVKLLKRMNRLAPRLAEKIMKGK